MTNRISQLLDNYRNLIAKVDEHCRNIEAEYRGYIACRKGCDTCCQHISIFPVEAVSLALALEQLPDSVIESIRSRAQTLSSTAPCPLIENGVCQLYNWRPIICRTHGLPIVISEHGIQKAVCCPMNFKTLSSLPARALIALEPLNQMLSAVNALFVENFFSVRPPNRLSIAQAVLMHL